MWTLPVEISHNCYLVYSSEVFGDKYTIAGIKVPYLGQRKRIHFSKV